MKTTNFFSNLFKRLLTLTLVFFGASTALAQWEPLEYNMDIKIDYDSKKIYGDCRITIRNISDTLSNEVFLKLYRLMSVSSIHDKNGNEISFNQAIKTYKEIPRLQVNQVSIPLNKWIKPNECYEFRIFYDGYLFGYTEGIGPYVMDNIDKSFTIIRLDAFAYPSIGKTTLESMYATIGFSYRYNAKITVPENQVVANGGRLVTKQIDGGKVTFEYESIKPAWRMDFAIAPYGILEDGGFRIFYFEDNLEGAERVMGLLKQTIKLYNEWFGPLKDFQNFSIIQIPEGYGSQADVTSILQTAEVFYDERYNPGLYHELSHLWHPMENTSLPIRWNEGLATFFEYYVEEIIDKKSGNLKKGSELMQKHFVNQCRSIPECKDTPLIDYGKTQMFSLCYTKGMVMFHVLFEIIGKENFMKLVGDYYRKYYQTGGTTEQLIEMILEYPYNGLKQFVQEWFYGIESNEYLFQGMSVDEIVAIYKM